MSAFAASVHLLAKRARKATFADISGKTRLSLSMKRTLTITVALLRSAVVQSYESHRGSAAPEKRPTESRRLAKPI